MFCFCLYLQEAVLLFSLLLHCWNFCHSCMLIVMYCILCCILIILHVTRIKRSNSQELDDKLDEFKRNGLRATTGGRLGWSKEVKYVIYCLTCLFVPLRNYSLTLFILLLLLLTKRLTWHLVPKLQGHVTYT